MYACWHACAKLCMQKLTHMHNPYMHMYSYTHVCIWTHAVRVWTCICMQAQTHTIHIWECIGMMRVDGASHMCTCTCACGVLMVLVSGFLCRSGCTARMSGCTALTYHAPHMGGAPAGVVPHVLWIVVDHTCVCAMHAWRTCTRLLIKRSQVQCSASAGDVPLSKAFYSHSFALLQRNCIMFEPGYATIVKF